MLTIASLLLMVLGISKGLNEISDFPKAIKAFVSNL